MTTVLFRDDFEAGALDATKWQPNWLGPNDQAVTPPINGHEIACYDPAMVDVAGRDAHGYLRLRAETHDTVDYHGSRYAYRSGCVTTRRSFTCVPPVDLEARLWLAGTDRIDNWPAFWADGTGQWPHTGELDVVEGISGKAEYHFHSVTTGAGGTGALKPRAGQHGEWHKFVAKWRADHVDFEYDDVHVGTLSAGITTAPMYLILNLALSPSISPPVVAPSEMRVAYVQVSQAA